mmetsp:Transcript_36126/g.43151  ORF Transcript_36126/g.43151 Transcript_36126/m.43151 type:complete len:233 (+) Transcript_36126:384-1082(+)
MKKSTLSAGGNENEEETRMERILTNRAYARKSREKKSVYLGDLMVSKNTLTKNNDRLAFENERLRRQVILLTKNTQEVMNKLSKREASSNLWTPQLSSQEDHELSVMRGAIKMLDRAVHIRSNMNKFDQMERMGGDTNVFDSDVYNTRDGRISNARANHERQCFNNYNFASHFDPFPPLRGLVSEDHISNPNGTHQFEGLNAGNYTRASTFKFAGHVSASTPPHSSTHTLLP